MSFEFLLVRYLRWVLGDRCVVSGPEWEFGNFCSIGWIALVVIPLLCRVLRRCMYGIIDFVSVVVIVYCPSRGTVSALSLNPDVMLGYEVWCRCDRVGDQDFLL
jgi:hypothetical protein